MLKQNLAQIFSLTDKGNNLGEPITVVGASKTMSVEVINEAIKLGLKVVAENKVQEFNQKHDFIVGADQHFIGHLQTNKVKYLVGKVKLIHSVDSIHLAEAINARAEQIGTIQDVLLEVNVANEQTKSGFNYDEIEQVANELSSLDNLQVKGLMAMLPNTDDEQLLSLLCQKMRALFDKLKASGFDFEYLSVGMSQDYKIAIKNGSNMIRLGRTIFGERNY